MVTKIFGIDFDSVGGALTLSPKEVDDIYDKETKCHTRRHPDGWIISGKIHEDYYYWVNDFEARHQVYKKVWGNFEDKVYADSEEGFADFFAKHPPEDWDYGDI